MGKRELSEAERRQAEADWHRAMTYGALRKVWWNRSREVRMTPKEQPQRKEEQAGALEVEAGMAGNAEGREREEDQRE